MGTVVSRSLAVGLALAFSACGGDDAFSPTNANVAGTYTATTRWRRADAHANGMR